MELSSISLTDAISLASSIGTLLAVLLSLLTLREMKVQRAAAYKPEVFITGQKVSILLSQTRNRFPVLWQSSEPTRNEEDQITDTIMEHKDISKSERMVFIKLLNLGNGAAKSIRVGWEVAIDDLAKSINSMAQKSSFNVFVDISDKHWTKINYAEPNHPWLLVSNTQNEEYDYLLSSSIDKSGLLTPIPSIFTALAPIYLRLTFLTPEEISETYGKKKENPLLLKMKISYYDIVGNKYHSDYVLEFFIYGYWRPNDHEHYAKIRGEFVHRLV